MRPAAPFMDGWCSCDWCLRLVYQEGGQRYCPRPLRNWLPISPPIIGHPAGVRDPVEALLTPCFGAPVEPFETLSISARGCRYRCQSPRAASRRPRPGDRGWSQNGGRGVLWALVTSPISTCLSRSGRPWQPDPGSTSVSSSRPTGSTAASTSRPRGRCRPRPRRCQAPRPGRG